MASNGIEIGAHSVSHPFLSRISKSSDLDFEIVGSKRRAEEQLNRRVKHFCYPTGSVEDVGPEAVDAVMRCGFLTGVCSELGFVPAQANPYFLPRFAVDATDPKLFFARTVSGYRAPRPRGISASRAAVERMEPVQMARSGAKAD